MLYMVVENYIYGPERVYERFTAHGRLLPEGLRYLDSWVVDNEALDRCYQLVETDDPTLFDQWLDQWRDLVRFEIYPVIPSSEAAPRFGANS
jgi:hypothetical protein